MFVKVFASLGFSALFLVSVESIAASYVVATPSKIVLDESTTIDWSRYYPNKYPNQTYNLYVEKSSGEPKFKYRSGLTATSDVRGPNTMSGIQTIQVEVCDQNGNNCISSSRGRVRFSVDHLCEYKEKYTNGGYAYYCEGNKVSQTVAPNSNPLGLPDSISGFISIKNRVYWMFTEHVNQYTTRFAWYTNCRSGGQLEKVTELVTNTSYPGVQNFYDRIDNFIPFHNNNKAEWYFYDAHLKISTHREAFFNQC